MDCTLVICWLRVSNTCIRINTQVVSLQLSIALVNWVNKINIEVVWLFQMDGEFVIHKIKVHSLSLKWKYAILSRFRCLISKLTFDFEIYWHTWCLRSVYCCRFSVYDQLYCNLCQIPSPLWKGVFGILTCGWDECRMIERTEKNQRIRFVWRNSM